MKWVAKETRFKERWEREEEELYSQTVAGNLQQCFAKMSVKVSVFV